MEEEGIGIASDVVKVQGEDPATLGSLRFVDTRKPRDRNDSPISVQYIKATHGQNRNAVRGVRRHGALG